MMTSEAWLLDAGNPEGEFQCIRPREAGIEYWVEHARDPEGPGRLLILSTLETPNGRVLTAPILDPGSWREIVPHRSDVKIDGDPAEWKGKGFVVKLWAKSVCRFAGSMPMILRMSRIKPMSSIRSASSNTR